MDMHLKPCENVQMNEIVWIVATRGTRALLSNSVNTIPTQGQGAMLFPSVLTCDFPLQLRRRRRKKSDCCYDRNMGCLRVPVRDSLRKGCERLRASRPGSLSLTPSAVCFWQINEDSRCWERRNPRSPYKIILCISTFEYHQQVKRNTS